MKKPREDIPPEDVPPIPNLSIGRDRAYHPPEPQIVGPDVVELSIWGRIIRFFLQPKDSKGNQLPELPRATPDPEDPMTWDDAREEAEIEARQRGHGHNWEREQDREQRFRSQYELQE